MKIEKFFLVGKKHEHRISPILAEIFGFELPHQCERLATAIRNLAGEKFELHIKRRKRKKTKTALGFYHGGLVRAQVMDDRGLRYDPNQIPNDWREHRKNGMVTLGDCDRVDESFRFEFFYTWVNDLKKGKHRVPKDLADYDNPELLKLIDDVMQWRADNGYPYLDVEEYKKVHRMVKKAEVDRKDIEKFNEGLERPKGPTPW